MTSKLMAGKGLMRQGWLAVLALALAATTVQAQALDRTGPRTGRPSLEPAGLPAGWDRHPPLKGDGVVGPREADPRGGDASADETRHDGAPAADAVPGTNDVVTRAMADDAQRKRDNAVTVVGGAGVLLLILLVVCVIGGLIRLIAHASGGSAARRPARYGRRSAAQYPAWVEQAEGAPAGQRRP